MMRKTKNRILIVDDEFSVRDSLYKWFKSDNFSVDTAEDANIALEKLKKSTWDIVLLDIKMPGMDGLELNRRIQKMQKNIIVILITAYASVDTAVEALKDGAYEYISKPVDPDKLSNIVRNAIEKRLLTMENVQLRQKIEDLSSIDEIVGVSPQLRKVLKMVSLVAKTDSTVMIRGKSGTGKELIARAIHSNSSRRYAPIISINCGAFTETLLESGLFGHVKGAFTGADRLRIGKFERANEGTIFFDEIGNISMKMQSDLLRVLETKSFTRLGSEKIISSDFRVVSATNCDLEREVVEGRFREDLYFRLNVVTINIPELKERKEDILLLARYFLNNYSQSMNKNLEGISPEAVEMLLRYEWPGNVRELRNVIERAIVVCDACIITPQDLSFPFSARFQDIGNDSLEEVERMHIGRILSKANYNVSRAAKILKVDRTTLYNKMKKYNLGK